MLSHDVTRLEEVLPVATADVVNALAAYVWVHPNDADVEGEMQMTCLLYTSPSPRDLSTSRMPSSA